ncbi:MAG: sugar transferase [Planctomycetes bacterium]|nr:sugar transferase [Planctomycetota bacterium]
MLDQAPFEDQLIRERLRSDRTGAPLVLAVLNLPVVRWEGRIPSEAVERLRSRLRATDVLGWFGPKKLGVLLTDTDLDGARAVVAALDGLLERGPGVSPWRLYAYPDVPSADSNPPSKRNSGDRRGHRSVAPHPLDATDIEVIEPDVDAEGESVATTNDATSGEVEPLRALFLQPSSWTSRGLDLLGSGLALMLVAPVILLAGIAVKLTSPGPVFFRQKRCGLGGRPFEILKLRTMYIDAEARKKELLQFNEQTGPVFKMTHDPRITPIGRFLRRTSIDELPQFWNVFRGDMTLVGPRPPIPAEVQDYATWQLRRLEVPGGLTCIWQVSGRSTVLFEDWVRMDIRYSKQRSLFFDLGLILRTIPAVLTCRGAR